MYALKKLSVPKNLATGEGHCATGYKITVIEEMKTSKRAGNGLFTITNEKSFKKKVAGKVTRVTNDFKDEYKLEHHTRSRSRGGTAHYFYLRNKEFIEKIPLGYDNYIDLIGACTIDKGVIINPLIYTNYGFVTKEMLDELVEAEEKRGLKEKNNTASIKEPRAFKRNLVAGKIYAAHDPKTGSKDYQIFYGTLSTSKGDFMLFERVYGRSDQTIRNIIASIGRGDFSKVYFNRHYHVNPNINPTDGRAQFAYPVAGGYGLMNKYYMKFVKTVPKIWEVAEDNRMADLNIYDTMTIKETKKLEGIMGKPLGFAIGKGMTSADFNGIKELPAIIAAKIEQESKEEEVAS